VESGDANVTRQRHGARVLPRSRKRVHLIATVN
jgi:hypothetical protein